MANAVGRESSDAAERPYLCTVAGRDLDFTIFELSREFISFA